MGIASVSARRVSWRMARGADMAAEGGDAIERWNWQKAGGESGGRKKEKIQTQESRIIRIIALNSRAVCRRSSLPANVTTTVTAHSI